MHSRETAHPALIAIVAIYGLGRRAVRRLRARLTIDLFDHANVA